MVGTLLNATQSVRVRAINARRGSKHRTLGHMEGDNTSEGLPDALKTKKRLGEGKQVGPKPCKQGELHPEAGGQGLSRIGR